MSPVTTQTSQSTPSTAVLHVAFELAEKQWVLGFTPGLGQPPRLRRIPARDLDVLTREITRALARFDLPAGTRVVSCYEAGRDGFWLHRALLARGIENRVVDAASIEVNRRARRAKADRLDALKLVTMLVREVQGDPRVWRVVRVPTEAEEDARQLHREIDALTGDRTRVLNRIHGLLANQGVKVSLKGDVPTALAALRRWNGRPLPPALRERLEREWAEVQHLATRIDALKDARGDELAEGDTPAHDQMRQLAELRGIGPTIACVLVREFFGWRQFRNRRQVGGCAGLTPTPFQTGNSHHEQGISKAGNRYVRHVAIELAWLWVRHQPGSELSRWYEKTFRGGSSARCRVGIVALARKLLIALWRYLETGVLPAGAVTKA